MKRLFWFVAILAIVCSSVLTKADCPPDIETWECYEDAVNFYYCSGGYFPDCVIEFDYCIRVGWDGQTYHRDVYIDRWEIKNGSCNCIDPQQLALLYIFQNHHLLLAFPGNTNFVIHTQPCWRLEGSVHLACEDDACCLSEYTVSYNKYWDKLEEKWIIVITGVEFLGYTDPLVTCEGYGCVSNCTSWIFPDNDWDDYISSNMESIEFDDELEQPKQVILSNQTKMNNSKNIIVYPNPNSGYITIDLQMIETEISNLQISDLKGKIVFEICENEINERNLLNIDISNYQSGIYNVYVYSKDIATYHTKFIIER